MDVQVENRILQVQLLELVQQLERVHEAWKQDFPNGSWEVRILNRTPPPELEATKSPRPPFESVLYFEDMWRAYEFILFNTILILALQLLQSVSGPQVVNSVLLTMFPDHPNCSVQSLAVLICRSAEYLFLDIHHSRGYISYTFCASIAYMILAKESPEITYLHDMCSLNASSNGFGFGAAMLNQVTPLGVWIEGLKGEGQITSPTSRATTETLFEEEDVT